MVSCAGLPSYINIADSSKVDVHLSKEQKFDKVLNTTMDIVYTKDVRD